jgi:hypothetical protein
MKKIKLLSVILFCSPLLACSNDDDNNNGILGPDDKVLVKLKINGVAWESRKDEGSAAVNSGGQL